MPSAEVKTLASPDHSQLQEFSPILLMRIDGTAVILVRLLCYTDTSTKAVL